MISGPSGTQAPTAHIPSETAAAMSPGLGSAGGDGVQQPPTGLRGPLHRGDRVRTGSAVPTRGTGPPWMSSLSLPNPELLFKS